MPQSLTPGIGREIFHQMLRIRLIEEEIAARYPSESMRCPVHLSIGQEGVAAAVSAALRRSDQIVTTHRCHGHYLAKGGDLKAMLCEMMGRAAGCCGGRGGSMHLFDEAAGVLLSLPIVAASIPVGVGAALAMQQRGVDDVAVVYLGDGSVEEGVFHESANFAALKSLPVVFICENNLYAVYTNLADRQPDRPLEHLALAHGMPGVHVDGNDCAALYGATVQAVSRARSGQGPTFIVADTYRWREHCGPNFDNHIGYRTEAEYLAWKERDPLVRLSGELRDLGWLTAADEQQMGASIRAEIAEAFAFADAAPFPDPDTAEQALYAL